MPTLTHDGIRFSYLDRGTGPPLVLQHGLGGDMAQPDDLYRSGGRLICLECRAHGATEPLGPPDRLGFATFADDLLALLDHLELERVTLGGISMGAGVALRLAAEHPERVSALVLIRPAWFDAAWPEHLRVFDTLATILHHTDGEAAKALLRQAPAFRAIARSAYAATSLLAQIDRPHAQARALVLQRMLRDFPLSDGPSWQDVAAPTLVLGTREDLLHPFSTAVATAGALRLAELREATPRGVDAPRHADEVTAAIGENSRNRPRSRKPTDA